MLNPCSPEAVGAPSRVSPSPLYSFGKPLALFWCKGLLLLALMIMHVFTLASTKQKIFQAVIGSISVKMMHTLSGGQITAQIRFHYKAAFRHITSMFQAIGMPWRQNKDIAKIPTSTPLPIPAFRATQMFIARWRRWIDTMATASWNWIARKFSSPPNCSDSYASGPATSAFAQAGRNLIGGWSIFAHRFTSDDIVTQMGGV